MSKNKDSWCATLHRKNKPSLSGGAARNVRIAESGGMDEIIESVALDAARNALQKANYLASGIKNNNVIPKGKSSNSTIYTSDTKH